MSSTNMENAMGEHAASTADAMADGTAGAPTTALAATTLDGGRTEIDSDEVEAFADRLRGTLLRPGADGYDTARRVWNGMIDHRPAVIARCAGAADVVRSVDFAREHGLLVAVRGGGHNVAGNAVCDGGIVIDLSPMKGVRVDPVGRTVRAQGGVTWGELDDETQAFGLATPGGFISGTGITGLTLGGGIAWLMSSHGLACDNLVSADVVTADGRLLTASATENEDLFWGLRGGGGNFGVVTALEFRLHDVGPLVMAGMIAHPLERAEDVYAAFRDLTRGAPDELNALVAFISLPDGTRVAAVGVCSTASPETCDELVRPVREIGPPLADTIGPLPYTQAQRLFDEMYGPGQRVYWKSGFLKELDDGAIRTMTEHFRKGPSPLAHSFVESFHGAVRRVDREATAFPLRDASYNFSIMSLWTDPADDAAHIGWVREYWAAMGPYLSEAVYVNYLGQAADEGEERVRAAYGPSYERLVALKTKYDPTNLFRLNQNIRPA